MISTILAVVFALSTADGATIQLTDQKTMECGGAYVAVVENRRVAPTEVCWVVDGKDVLLADPSDMSHQLRVPQTEFIPVDTL
jgi:hypothetical protein